MKIVVLDSGLDINSKLASDIHFNGGLGFKRNVSTGKIEIVMNAVDDSGHGTAVCNCLHKLVPDDEIIPIKVINTENVADTELLCFALEYICDCICCDIINVSLGVVGCSDIDELNRICLRIKEKGIIIVAAYDNAGALSYPACLDCVVGVDGMREKRLRNRYMKVLHRKATYIAEVREKILPMLDGKNEICSGNSFLAPEFSAKISNILKNQKCTFEELVEILDKGACSTIAESNVEIRKIPFQIKRAVVFPFNKEMHSIARYEKDLKFEVVGYYDTKYSRNVGKSVSEISGGCATNEYIKDIETLDWESQFDTFILGHTSVISEVMGCNFEEQIIEKIKKYKKNIFSCHHLLEDSCQIYSPYVILIYQNIIN